MHDEMKFKISVFLPIIESLLCNLKERRQAYSDFGDKFSFLSNFAELKTEDIFRTVKILTRSFPEDFTDEVELRGDLELFIAFIPKEETVCNGMPVNGTTIRVLHVFSI